MRTLLLALGASVPLLVGGVLGAWWRPPDRLVAVALAFAAGALGVSLIDGGSVALLLALPLAFAGGAVLASVIDRPAPEAFRQGGPWIALASAAGVVMTFELSG